MGVKASGVPARSVWREVKLAADRAEQVGMRVTAGEAEQDTSGGDCYPGGDFQKRQADRRHLSSGKPRRGKHGSSEGLDQDIRKARQHQAKLVCEKVVAARTVGKQHQLLFFDVQ